MALWYFPWRHAEAPQVHRSPQLKAEPLQEIPPQRRQVIRRRRGDKVVRVAAVDPQVALDPQQYTYSIIMKITDNITESLLMTNGDGSLEPVLLTGMPEISEDQLTYSFELLPDVKFHNGESLKSSDVKYSYERLIKMAKMATLLENVVGYDELSAGTADKLSGGVDCGISNWYVDYSDPESMLYPMTKTDTNSSFWHNAEFEQLLEDGIATTDTAERQEIYAKAEHIMTREDWATTPLYNETKYYLLNPDITGFEIDSTFRMFWKNADIQ